VFDWSGRRPTLGWQDDHPMANVTWDEARSYCRWAGGDLPSMAQWEKAGRGTDGRTFPWGNKFDTSKMQMWQSSFGGYHETARVGAFPSGASPYGCLDMEGNVAQWCLDLPVAGETPPNFPPGVRRAIEGCGYDTSDSAEARIGTIAFWWPDSPMETYGFRIAASHRLTLPMLRRDPDAAISEPLPDPTPPAWPSARLSPDADYDGRRVLAARGKDVLLWDTETGKLLRRFTGHTTAVTAVAFERDGRHILTGSDGGTAPVRVWEIATGHVTMRFPSLDGTIRSLELSPKADEFLANEFKDGGRSPDHGRLMDATFGNEMFATPGGQARYSPDGTAILDVDREGFWVALWDVETFKEIFRVEPLANVYDAVTADVASWGDRLAVSFQGTVTIWDFRDHKKLFEIGGPQDRLYLARFTSNGDRLVATGRRGEIRVYDAESGKAVRLIKGPERVDDLLLSPDGARCLAKWEAGASLWDLESGKELARFARSDSIVGFAPDSKTLFAVSKDGRGVVVDATTGKRIRTVMLR
ncbi:MAG TPA: SUMF1/EgtB/PvdO family nonheme iron enzyme, partial [Fimbriimonadaceae bacterium]|nr:SUMF1/EgtB/PvdO family nonheme iron enzyme [Fimbriimonadaceae bacterium]